MVGEIPCWRQPGPRRRETVAMSRRPIWHKNNFGFWLSVCIIVSLLFSIIYRSVI